MPNDKTNEEDHPHESFGGADNVGGVVDNDGSNAPGSWVDETWLGPDWRGASRGGSTANPGVHQQPGADPDSDAGSPDADGREGYYDAGGFYIEPGHSVRRPSTLTETIRDINRHSGCFNTKGSLTGRFNTKGSLTGRTEEA